MVRCHGDLWSFIQQKDGSVAVFQQDGDDLKKEGEEVSIYIERERERERLSGDFAFFSHLVETLRI